MTSVRLTVNIFLNRTSKNGHFYSFCLDLSATIPFKYRYFGIVPSVEIYNSGISSIIRQIQHENESSVCFAYEQHIPDTFCLNILHILTYSSFNSWLLCFSDISITIFILTIILNSSASVNVNNIWLNCRLSPFKCNCLHTVSKLEQSDYLQSWIHRRGKKPALRCAY